MTSFKNTMGIKMRVGSNYRVYRDDENHIVKFPMQQPLPRFLFLPARSLADVYLTNPCYRVSSTNRC
jgi:hypothetical protein